MPGLLGLQPFDGRLQEGHAPGEGGPALKTGTVYAFEYETEDVLKPFVQKSRSGKTTY